MPQNIAKMLESLIKTSDFKGALFLAQSDTTAGFLSVDKSAISKAKGRDSTKPILQETSTIAHIKQDSRIPKVLNKAIRRARKTTFIFPNGKSYRIVRESCFLQNMLDSKNCDFLHAIFLQNFGRLYSSSANISSKRFNPHTTKDLADIIVLDRRGLSERNPSQIFQARHDKLRKIR